MSEPYYQDDLVTLFHGDCLTDHREWLDADVLVTDPPYGMAYVSNASKYGSTDAIAGDATLDARNAVLDAWSPRPALVFGTWRVERPKGARQLVVWDKGDSPGMGDLKLPWGPSHEEIYVLGDGFTGKRGGSVVRVNTMSASAAERPDHPTPKPIPLMERLIEKCPPGVIADPFAGSGATLLAAVNLGRKVIGVGWSAVQAADEAVNRMYGGHIRGALAWLIERGEPFTADDIAEIAEHHAAECEFPICRQPHSANLIGSIIGTAARAGRITRTGNRRRSTHPSRNAAYNAEWKAS